MTEPPEEAAERVMRRLLVVASQEGSQAAPNDLGDASGFAMTALAAAAGQTIAKRAVEAGCRLGFQEATLSMLH